MSGPGAPRVWNAQQEAQDEAQREQVRQQRARQEDEERAALRRNLPVWRASLAAIGPAIAAAKAEADRLDAAEGAAWQRYGDAYYAQTGGSTPRGPGGELVLLRPLEGMHPDDVARMPARRELEAQHKAAQAAQEAHRHLDQLEADKRALEHNLRVCQEAGVR